jgi:CBS-domain-containing membrane protein
MEPGPTTVRASRQLEPLLEALAGDAESFALVTDSDGRLLGVVRTVSDGSRSPVPDR